MADSGAGTGVVTVWACTVAVDEIPARARDAAKRDITNGRIRGTSTIG
jgi:hypothetical protein